MYKNINPLKKAFDLSPLILKNIFATFYSVLISRKKYSKKYYYWRNILVESEKWSRVNILSFQHKMWQEFVQFTIEHSVYYKKIIKDNSINIDDPNQNFQESIKKFPILTKAEVKDNYYDIRTPLSIIKRQYKFSSSGTTGTPLHVYMDDDSYQREYAFRWHFLKVGGAKRKKRFAFFIGNKLYPSDQLNPPFHIVDYSEKSIFFSIFHLSKKNIKYYVKQFNKFKPEFVKGYPSALYTFVSLAVENNLHLHQPKAVYSASEVLRDYQKEFLEKHLNTTVFQWYGQAEITGNIHECEYRKLHIKEEYGFMELLDKNGEDVKPGDSGQIIGTSWGNRAFPLIRYNTGDKAVLAMNQNCKCGRNGRVIEKILGRDEDVIITPEGKLVGRLDFVFKEITHVKEAQIIQESRKEILIKIVPEKGYPTSNNQKVIRVLQNYLGEKMDIQVINVQEIERLPNGKFKYVISKL